jgi:hypothetical protein
MKLLECEVSQIVQSKVSLLDKIPIKHMENRMSIVFSKNMCPEDGNCKKTNDPSTSDLLIHALLALLAH